MSGRVVHFEVPYDDGDRASFYGDVFGWQIQRIPEMQYDIVSTGPAGEGASRQSRATSAEA